VVSPNPTTTGYCKKQKTPEERGRGESIHEPEQKKRRNVSQRIVEMWWTASACFDVVMDANDVVGEVWGLFIQLDSSITLLDLACIKECRQK
jgi:hypothetical protein